MRLMNLNYCTQSATVVTASSADTNFPVSNLKHPFRSKRWRSTDVDAEDVVFDLITTEEIDSVVLLWPKEDGIRLSNTAVVKIQANATDSWGSPSVDETLTISDDYVMASHYFTSDKSYRYWRVVIEDPDNANGFIELGVVWLGKGINIQNAQNGFSYDLVDRSKTTTNDFGHTYVDEYPQVSTLQFSYQYLSYSDIQILENAFRLNGTRDPVFMVLDPADDIFDKDHYAIYGKFQPKFGSKHVNYDILSADQMTIVELS